MTESPSWTALAAPLRAPIVWDAVAVAPERDALFLAPRVAAEAVRERLDAVLGVDGWSASFVALPGEAVACHVQIGTLTKAGVASVNAALDGARAADRAFALAAASFGIAAAAAADLAPRWVACDPLTLTVAADPWGETRDEPRLAAGPAGPAAMEAAMDLPMDDAMEAAMDDAMGAALPDPTAEGGAPVGSLDAPPSAAADDGAKPESQRIIDRLIERLKERGQGLAAARILVRHGGYGRDPAAARDLYAALRALLLSGSRDG